MSARPTRNHKGIAGEIDVDKQLRKTAKRRESRCRAVTSPGNPNGRRRRETERETAAGPAARTENGRQRVAEQRNCCDADDDGSAERDRPNESRARENGADRNTANASRRRENNANANGSIGGPLARTPTRPKRADPPTDGIAAEKGQNGRRRDASDVREAYLTDKRRVDMLRRIDRQQRAIAAATGKLLKAEEQRLKNRSGKRRPSSEQQRRRRGSADRNGAEGNSDDEQRRPNDTTAATASASEDRRQRRRCRLRYQPPADCTSSEDDRVGEQRSTPSDGQRTRRRVLYVPPSSATTSDSDYDCWTPEATSTPRRRIGGAFTRRSDGPVPTKCRRCGSSPCSSSPTERAERDGTDGVQHDAPYRRPLSAKSPRHQLAELLMPKL